MWRRGSAVLIALAATALAGAGAVLTTAQAHPESAGAISASATGSVGQTARGIGMAWHGTGRNVVIKDIKIHVPHQPPVDAYLVKPQGTLHRKSSAGILFLHWLGQIHNDRTEYLGEAVTLANQGVISVLPQGYFPWVPNPDGTTNDITLVRDQVAAMRSALDRLVSVRGVDRSRVALVGHDYGAMYGSLLADTDRRISTMVLEAPDSLMGNWFAKYWLQLEGQARDDYLALFDGLDPVDHTARLGSRVLFQWAGQDEFIPTEVQDAYAASSPAAQVRIYPNSDHQLTDAAQVDRDAFLTVQLGLPTP